MLTHALLLLLLASPDAVTAQRLAKAAQWDELYLAFAATTPSPAQRPEVAQALRAGCEALAPTDAALAFSLALRAQELSPSADTALCLARCGAQAQQRDAAREALEAALRAAPRDDRLRLALAEVLLEDRDFALALAQLAAVPQGAAQRKAAGALEAKAREGQRQLDAARAQLAADAKGLARAQQRAAASAPGPGATEPRARDEGPRGSSAFTVRFFDKQRDRVLADTKREVLAVLEEARATATRIVGMERTERVEVILYTPEEFVDEHPMARPEGGARVGGARVGGFYVNSTIHLPAIDAKGQDRDTLVHEYVHAVVDERSRFRDFRVPTWMNEGLATWAQWQLSGTEPVTQAALAEVAGQGRLPTLRSMMSRSLSDFDDRVLRYGVCGWAVTLMMETGGTENFWALLREVSTGKPFDKAFLQRYGVTLVQFEEKLTQRLRSTAR